MATELRADLNKALKLVEAFVKRYLLEGVLVIIVCICCILTVGNHFRTNGAVDTANKSDVRSTSIENRLETELQRMALEFERELRRSDEQWASNYTDFKKEVRLLQNKIDRYEADLHAQENN